MKSQPLTFPQPKRYKTEPFVVNIGPQHPSTHGVFRMILTLDGEKVVDCVPAMGYLHRCVEKLAEGRSYVQNIPWTDRMDYFSSPANNLALVVAIEKLIEVKVPERAEYLRVITAELARLASHLAAVGFFLNDCGAFQTPVIYCFRDREMILDLFEMASGARLTCNYIRPGGVSRDVPEEFWPALRTYVDKQRKSLDELEWLITGNEIFMARCKKVGVITAPQAIDAGLSGPMLRSTGVKWDIRKNDPYSVYDRFDWEVVTHPDGDCYARYLVKMGEMRQSLRIIEQAAAQIPSGEVWAPLPFFFRPPPGEAYGRIEAPKGELGFYLVSDGSIKPYRFKIRSPSFINLTLLRDMLIGSYVQDAIIIFGSIDIVMGEVDR